MNISNETIQQAIQQAFDAGSFGDGFSIIQNDVDANSVSLKIQLANAAGP